jgi:hypothetical protein
MEPSNFYCNSLHLFVALQNVKNMVNCNQYLKNSWTKILLHKYTWLNAYLSIDRHIKRQKISNTFNVIIPTIKYLKMDDKFNQPIILPESLTSLTMGMSFNQAIMLPESLTSLKMGF